jgi:hypothetical protein
MTEFERSGKLEIARGRRKNSERLDWANAFAPLAWLTGSALIVVGTRASRDYRSWTLQQLALATAYLLGPDEAMLAGEGGTLGAGHLDLPPWRRDLAWRLQRPMSWSFESIPSMGNRDGSHWPRAPVT